MIHVWLASTVANAAISKSVVSATASVPSFGSPFAKVWRRAHQLVGFVAARARVPAITATGAAGDGHARPRSGVAMSCTAGPKNQRKNPREIRHLPFLLHKSRDRRLPWFGGASITTRVNGTRAPI